MGKNTSVVLGDHFESFINLNIETGRYGSASEVIRAALRLLEEHEEKRTLLKQALIKGEESGFVNGFDPKNLLQEIHAKHGVE